jgi:hypothetical protein
MTGADMVPRPNMDSIRDAEGRVPHIPGDHRHSRHTPDRISISASIPFYVPGRRPGHDEIIDRMIQLCTRFGLDVHTIPRMRSLVLMVLYGATAVEAIDKVGIHDFPDPTAQDEADLEAAYEQQGRTLLLIAETFALIQNELEAVAFRNHMEWVTDRPDALTTEELRRSRQRSREALPHLTGERHNMLEEVLSDMDDMLARR